MSVLAAAAGPLIAAGLVLITPWGPAPGTPVTRMAAGTVGRR